MERLGEGWDVPSVVKDEVEFHWFHVAPGRALVLCVLSTSPVWYVGHFENGRMGKCSGDGCPSCARGVGKQIRYVLSVVDVSTHQLGVIELSQSVADLVRAFSDRHGVMRGMVLDFTKAARSKHSRMEVSYIDQVAPGWCTTMEGLDLREVLGSTWERIRASDAKRKTSGNGSEQPF
jgi:hypothetical protein